MSPILSLTPYPALLLLARLAIAWNHERFRTARGLARRRVYRRQFCALQALDDRALAARGLTRAGIAAEARRLAMNGAC